MALSEIAYVPDYVTHVTGSDPTLDARYVTARLEEAGATLLALPLSGHSTRLRSSRLEVVNNAMEAYGWNEPVMRPPVPPARRISAMDEALAWISFIPLERYVLRRIVGARALVHSLTERHLFSWRRLGRALGADHRAIKNWHAEGIDLIVAALSSGRFIFPA